MVCEPCCRRFCEAHPAFEGRLTARLARRVVADARAMTVNAAARRHRLGHARHVLDRFRVIRWFQSGLAAVRRDVQRRPEGEKPRFDPDVFRARFLLMRRPDTLGAPERERLDAVFAAHP